MNPKLTSIEVIEEWLSPVLFQLDLNLNIPLKSLIKIFYI